MKGLITTTILALPLLVAALPNPASAFEVFVKPQVYAARHRSEYVVRKERREWIPAHWDYRDHHRYWVPSHYIYR